MTIIDRNVKLGLYIIVDVSDGIMSGKRLPTVKTITEETNSLARKWKPINADGKIRKRYVRSRSWVVIP